MNETITETTQHNNILKRWDHWLLRGPLVAIFIFMGIDKFAGTGVGGFAAAMGFPVALGALIAVAEIGAGLLLLAGGFTTGQTGNWMTRLGALGMIPILLGAIFLVHWGQWHFLPTSTHPMGGMMFQVTMTGTALYLALKGNSA